MYFSDNDYVKTTSDRILEIFNMPTIRDKLTTYSCFDIQNTQVEYIPDCVAQLTKTETFWCHGNPRLTHLPPSIGTSMAQLRLLSVQDCKNLRMIPSTYTALTNLRVVIIKGTALPREFEQFSSNGPQSAKNYLRAVAICALRPARAVARALLTARRFRQSKLNALQLDCMRLICRMVVQDGDAPEWMGQHIYKQ